MSSPQADYWPGLTDDRRIPYSPRVDFAVASAVDRATLTGAQALVMTAAVKSQRDKAVLRESVQVDREKLEQGLTVELEIAMTAEKYAGAFEQETDAALDKVKAAAANYRKAIAEWKSQAGNDVKSMASNGEAIKSQLERTAALARECVTLWNSPEMQRALATAQAMAEALRAINEIRPSKITFCAIGNDGGSNERPL